VVVYVLARVTRRSWDLLQLAGGTNIFAQVKGVAEHRVGLESLRVFSESSSFFRKNIGRDAVSLFKWRCVRAGNEDKNDIVRFGSALTAAFLSLLRCQRDICRAKRMAYTSRGVCRGAGNR
jgi:hypothetical protein